MKLISASKQELEVAFVCNSSDEVDKIKNLKAAVTHLAENGCANQLIIGDYNSNMNTDLNYVGYIQDPHNESRDFLFRLQEDNVFIDACRFLHPYDLIFTWKDHNTQKQSRIDIALDNQNFISGVIGMKNTPGTNLVTLIMQW